MGKNVLGTVNKFWGSHFVLPAAYFLLPIVWWANARCLRQLQRFEQATAVKQVAAAFSKENTT